MWAEYVNAVQVPGSGAMYFNPATGRNYIALFANAGLEGYGAEGGDYVLGAPTGYLSWDPSSNRDNQGPYLIHDAAGSVTGRGNFTKAQNIERLALTYGAALAAFGFGGSALMGGGATASAGGTLGANGAFLGEGVASGVGAWDAALSGIGTTASSTAASVGASLKSLPGLVKQAGPLLSALGLTGAAASPQPARVATAQTGDGINPLWLLGGAVALYLILKG